MQTNQYQHRTYWPHSSYSGVKPFSYVQLSSTAHNFLRKSLQASQTYYQFSFRISRYKLEFQILCLILKGSFRRAFRTDSFRSRTKQAKKNWFALLNNLQPPRHQIIRFARRADTIPESKRQSHLAISKSMLCQCLSKLMVAKVWLFCLCIRSRLV